MSVWSDTIKSENRINPSPRFERGLSGEADKKKIIFGGAAVFRLIICADEGVL